MAENKMEQVAAMNNCYKLLGKNGELITLRKEQVLAGAMQIIQQHYADKQNKMEAVAAMFGKRLGEEFVINDFDMKFKAKFEKDGMYHMVGKRWIPSCMFERLLLGRTVIIND